MDGKVHSLKGELQVDGKVHSLKGELQRVLCCPHSMFLITSYVDGKWSASA